MADEPTSESVVSDQQRRFFVDSPRTPACNLDIDATDEDDESSADATAFLHRSSQRKKKKQKSHRLAKRRRYKAYKRKKKKEASAALFGGMITLTHACAQTTAFCLCGLVGLLCGVLLTLVLLRDDPQFNHAISLMIHGSSSSADESDISNTQSGTLNPTMSFQVINDDLIPSSVLIPSMPIDKTKHRIIIQDSGVLKHDPTVHPSISPSIAAPTQGQTISHFTTEAVITPTEYSGSDKLPTITDSPSKAPSKSAQTSIMTKIAKSKQSKQTAKESGSNNFIPNERTSDGSSMSKCEVLFNANQHGNGMCESLDQSSLMTVYPLHHDRPLQAMFECMRHECSPVSLASPLSEWVTLSNTNDNDHEKIPSMIVMFGQTEYATQNLLSLDDSSKMNTRCLNNATEIPFRVPNHDDNSVKSQYENEMDHLTCISLRFSHTNLIKYSMRLDLQLLNMDVEPSFDNVFITTQFDHIYDDYYRVFTGNLDSDDNSKDNNDDGKSSNMMSWFLDFTKDAYKLVEICLRFQTDESVTASGFNGVFRLSAMQSGSGFTEWTRCRNQYYNGTAPDTCGSGIRSRQFMIPSEINENENEKNDNDDDDGRLSKRIAIQEQKEFCITRPCENIPLEVVDRLVPKAKNPGRKTHAMARGRHENTFADPFALIVNANQTLINLDQIRSELQKEYEMIHEKYEAFGAANDLDRAVWSSVCEGGDEEKQRRAKQFGVRSLKSLLLGKKFTMAMTGSSNTAGHDNWALSAYPFQVQSYLRPLFARLGVSGSGFRVRNSAVGGHLGTIKQAPCVNALIDSHDLNIDVIGWESTMNDGHKLKPLFTELWLRNALALKGSAQRTNQDRKWSQRIPVITLMSNKRMGYASCGGHYLFSPLTKYYDISNQTTFWSWAGKSTCPGNRKVEECSGLSASWHPSSKGHRMIAESMVASILKSTLNVLDEHGESLKQTMLIEVSEDGERARPTYATACLLDSLEIYMKRPLSKPKFSPVLGKSSPNWCATSHMTAALHSRLDWFIVSQNGSLNPSESVNGKHFTESLMAQMGGHMPSDVKSEMVSSRGQLFSVTLRVYVPSQFVVIPYSLSVSKRQRQNFENAEYWIDGRKQECFNYDAKSAKSKYPDLGALMGIEGDSQMSYCLLSCTKGKHLLTIQRKPGSTQEFRFDAVVGV